MRSLLISGLMILTTFIQAQDSTVQEKDSLVAFLETIDIEDYEKKATGVFLKDLPANYKIQITESIKKGYGYMAIISFPTQPYLEIQLYYRNLVYTNPNSFFRKKQRRQLKREKISALTIYNEFTCINGCDN